MTEPGAIIRHKKLSRDAGIEENIAAYTRLEEIGRKLIERQPNWDYKIVSTRFGLEFHAWPWVSKEAWVVAQAAPGILETLQEVAEFEEKFFDDMRAHYLESKEDITKEAILEKLADAVRKEYGENQKEVAEHTKEKGYFDGNNTTTSEDGGSPMGLAPEKS